MQGQEGRQERWTLFITQRRLVVHSYSRQRRPQPAEIHAGAEGARLGRRALPCLACRDGRPTFLLEPERPTGALFPFYFKEMWSGHTYFQGKTEVDGSPAAGASRRCGQAGVRGGRNSVAAVLSVHYTPKTLDEKQLGACWREGPTTESLVYKPHCLWWGLLEAGSGAILGGKAEAQHRLCRRRQQQQHVGRAGPPPQGLRASSCAGGAPLPPCAVAPSHVTRGVRALAMCAHIARMLV